MRTFPGCVPAFAESPLPRKAYGISGRTRLFEVVERAARFSPFAALTGYEAAIAETARQTSEKIEPDEDSKAALDQKQRLLIMEMIPDQPEVTVTYFQPDERKPGGAYVTVTGNMKKIDAYQRIIVMTDGTKIPWRISRSRKAIYSADSPDGIPLRRPWAAFRLI